MTKKQRDWIYLTSNGKKPPKLTDRQLEVLKLIAGGYRTKEIAFRLGCSEPNIRKIEAAIRRKLGARTNAHATVIYNELYR